MDGKINLTQEQIRECRSLLLDCLNSVYGSDTGSIAEDMIFAVMLQLDEPIASDFVARDLMYLESRGLIEKYFAPHRLSGVLENPHDPQRHLKAKVKRWRLTAKGVTFLERGKPWEAIETL